MQLLEKEYISRVISQNLLDIAHNFESDCIKSVIFFSAYVLFFSAYYAFFQHITYVLFFNILCAVFQHIMCCFSAYYVLFFTAYVLSHEEGTFEECSAPPHPVWASQLFVQSLLES